MSTPNTSVVSEGKMLKVLKACVLSYLRVNQKNKKTNIAILEPVENFLGKKPKQTRYFTEEFPEI